jgi:hypothetical protein
MITMVIRQDTMATQKAANIWTIEDLNNAMPIIIIIIIIEDSPDSLHNNTAHPTATVAIELTVRESTAKIESIYEFKKGE